METRIIGIDLAVTAKHKAIILDQATNTDVGSLLAFRSNPAELDRLLATARAGAGTDVRLVAVMEATGMSWYPVGVYLHQRGVTIYRVNGQKVKELRRVFWRHTGSDRIDAWILARLLQLGPEFLSPWQPPNGDQLALQRACREFDRWRQIDVAIQNRLQAYDQWAWHGLQKLVPARARSWMYRNWYDPWQVKQAGVDQLTASWQAAPSHETEQPSWISRWVERAEQMTTLFGSPAMVGYPQLQATISRQLDIQERSRQQREQLWEEIILPLYRQLYPACLLESIPGIGVQSAAFYMGFIQDIHRFRSVARFRNWCGMVPRSRQSGQSEAKGLRLTKAGPNLIKATLYQNAHVARLWDVQMAAIYYRQMVKHGKHHHQAICACASHLASRIYAVLKDQRPFQLRDLEGRPIDKSQSRKLCVEEYRVSQKVRQRNNKTVRRQSEEEKLEKRYQTPSPQR
jgi:transposase